MSEWCTDSGNVYSFFEWIDAFFNFNEHPLQSLLSLSLSPHIRSSLVSLINKWIPNLLCIKYTRVSVSERVRGLKGMRGKRKGILLLLLYSFIRLCFPQNAIWTEQGKELIWILLDWHFLNILICNHHPFSRSLFYSLSLSLSYVVRCCCSTSCVTQKLDENGEKI
jgi:hypothetical protein